MLLRGAKGGCAVTFYECLIQRGDLGRKAWYTLSTSLRVAKGSVALSEVPNRRDPFALGGTYPKSIELHRRCAYMSCRNRAGPYISIYASRMLESGF